MMLWKKKLAVMVSVAGIGLIFAASSQGAPPVKPQHPLKQPAASQNDIRQVSGIVKLPDLIVSEIQMVDNCQIRVTVKNTGPSGIPDSGYSMANGVFIQMYNGSRPWGGFRLSAVDREKRLQRPGGSFTFSWYPSGGSLELGPGVHPIKVVVDSNSAVTELSETNNELTQRIACP